MMDRWHDSYRSRSCSKLATLTGRSWLSASVARSVGGSWRMDETYVKVRGEWVYLYRPVDKPGKTVGFYLSRNRDVNAAQAFLRKAAGCIIRNHPQSITRNRPKQSAL